MPKSESGVLVAHLRLREDRVLGLRDFGFSAWASVRTGLPSDLNCSTNIRMPSAEESGSSLDKPRQFGTYYLQELINSGGMADIWFVTNQKNEPFALRLLRDKSFFNFTAKRRFLRGCEVLSRIHNHENVIGYVEHGKINGSLYLVME